ncbi:MAG: hypothetical protein EAX96_11430 [Candidatus Lokiarchaeota archaeon]|nr:hypothetical protein [Candidatus Lokiarchaeota archaeon]
MGVNVLETKIYQVSKEICDTVGNLLMKKVYIAVLDRIGQLYYSDPELDDLIEFVQTFTRTNFKLLTAGDHSIPLSNSNIVFFKSSDNIMIVLFMKDGRVGQLLTFKRKMDHYGNIFEDLLKDYIAQIRDEVFLDEQISISPELGVNPKLPNPEINVQSFSVPDQIISPTDPIKSENEPQDYVLEEPLELDEDFEGIKEIPNLLREMSDKDKFEINTSVVFQYCNGKNSIEDIIEKTKLDRKEVEEILERYQTKGWIKIQILEGRIKKDFKILPKIGRVSLALGFNPEEVAVLELCNGKTTVKEIAQKTGLPLKQVSEVLKKHEEESWMTIKWEGEPVMYPENLKPINPSAVQLGLMSKKEFNIRELSTGENTASAIAHKLGIPLKDLIKKLTGLEKKKTIKLNIQYY